MELSIGDVVEVYFANKHNVYGRVFGELLGTKNKRLRIAVWDGSQPITEYDEINLEIDWIVDIAKNETIEVEVCEYSSLH